MQPAPTVKIRPNNAAWISALTGVLGLLTFPVIIMLTIMEPSNEYAEPLHTITHDGPTLIFPVGFVLSLVAISIGIRALNRRLPGEVLEIIGIVTGGLGAFLTISPTIGIIVGGLRSI